MWNKCLWAPSQVLKQKIKAKFAAAAVKKHEGITPNRLLSFKKCIVSKKNIMLEELEALWILARITLWCLCSLDRLFILFARSCLTEGKHHVLLLMKPNVYGSFSHVHFWKTPSTFEKEREEVNSVNLVNIILLYRVLNLGCSVDWGHLAAPVISPDPGCPSILQTCIQHLIWHISCTALHSEYVLLNSGGRNRVPLCKHNRCTRASVHPTVSQVNEQIAPDGGGWWGALKAKWCWMCTVIFFPRLQLR